MKEELNCCRYLLEFYYLYLFKINVFSYYFQVVVRVMKSMKFMIKAVVIVD